MHWILHSADISLLVVGYIDITSEEPSMALLSIPRGNQSIRRLHDLEEPICYNSEGQYSGHKYFTTYLPDWYV